MAGHDEWLTPADLFAVLHAEFAFDLDASAQAHHAKCAAFITPEQDGLVTPWVGRNIWCNPPYSLIAEFVYRGWQQCQGQRATVVLLIPAYTDPAYWWDCIVPHADEIRFLKGRVSFRERSLSGKRESARFPSVIVVFRYRLEGGHFQARGPVVFADAGS
jgi:phage N-6-adenine-methyltransferase